VKIVQVPLSVVLTGLCRQSCKIQKQGLENVLNLPKLMDREDFDSQF
jgi:hypothetical protein